MSRDDPPEVYDWPYCQDYSLLLGDDTGEAVADVGCARCPMKHRCKDGAMSITLARNETMFCICEDCNYKQMVGAIPERSCKGCEVLEKDTRGAV